MTNSDKIDLTEGTPQNCGVINPYALAEVIAGRRINWSSVQNRAELLEDLLQTPYAELFDPVHEGPLYTGLKLDKDLNLKQVRSPLLDVVVELDRNDLDLPFNGDGDVRMLRDLGPRFDVKDVGDIAVARTETSPGGNLIVTLRLPDKTRLERLHTVLTPDLVRLISYDPEFIHVDDGWTPPGGQWGLTGEFFNEAAEFFDPVQGAVANCYYIAALSAMAWATPNKIVHSTRATGGAQSMFTDRISFYKPDSGGTVDKDIEVTEALPLSSGGGFIYCRSSETGEIWPAVYEKAFAKLKTGVSHDQPDITATGWGDCVWATAQLNGGNRSYFNTAGRTGDQMWDLVRGNSMSRRTIRPMTAWTYSTGAASEKKVVYADTNVVASHCYTVLGWDYRDGVKYLILRNPWGSTEPTVGVMSGNYTAYDISWWRSVALAPNDGTFGIEAGAFQKYFAGLGVAA
ncbi:MAG TPA: C2 family cysteine protease [Nocardioidaceae bacterium]|nr:C2 family cysteine protease [Nocardioidaceae bacterium]